MTAEIAVMNKWAVALAADSKVTISGMRTAKAYDTVNKLFTLSKIHPVGIMIFGNAEFMDYPWETIIKLYREQKGTKSEDYIEDWGKDFIKYLRRFGHISESHKTRNIQNTCSSWMYEIYVQAAETAASIGFHTSSPEFERLLIDILGKHTRSMLETPRWANLKQQSKIIKKYSEAIAQTVLGQIGRGASDELKRAAVSFACAALFHSKFSPQSSGLVVAGFGNKEYFPTLASYEVDGYIGDVIKISNPDVSDVSRSMSSCIRAFAQGDMVERFMNGFDSDFLNVITDTFELSLRDSCQAVLEKFGRDEYKTEDVKEQIMTAAAAAARSIVERTHDYKDERFSNPVIKMVALLPKDELANLAESLVALTSLKRRVSSDAETVGGPIDVALISKGDGFVWIKRKHYFPADLNHQFARNYMNRVKEEADNGTQSEPAKRRRRPYIRANTEGIQTGTG